MYTCIVYVGSDKIEVSIYDEDGRLVRYERVGSNVELLEVMGKYFRLSKSGFGKEVTVVCQVDGGIIEVSERMLRVS